MYKVILTFESVDEILNCNHSNESYRAFLFCASSTKSVEIVFDDRSDVLEKTMKVSIPSLPKENGVPMKINVIELRSPQASFNWQK